MEKNCLKDNMPFTLSPSSLSLLKDCPLCFWLHFNKGIKQPAGIFPSLPSGMDRVLKEHFDAYMTEGLLPPELKDLKGVKLFDDIELLTVWRNNFKGIRYTDGEGNVLRGAVDNILVKGKKLIVLDYKTRGYPVKEDTHEHYKDQLDIYNYLLRKNGYETEDYDYLLFYHPLKVLKDGSVEFHSHLVKMAVDVKNAERIFQKSIEVLKGRMPKASEECEYCKWAGNIHELS